ncbi:NADH-quinone oxidoreductase subunit J [Proteiniphilum sp.]|uniref:NADH-quinone oxidoreductase subunit J family protein n=1 Tax=Proteiniphilum sp. TaxID=1926877 RepID=UPI002B204045|nr:NADH-quinone oxidoreductase subunit J [Proteiniphilum sp.]MEA4918506.1 NADH-quinone oxidoreductase subunit J [Proteiniphilum sp.]
MIGQIVFFILAIVIALFSVLAVTSKQIIRSAIYLLFVLLATAGLFLILNYHFLFTVQITVYAGGIMILFIMAIFLTHRPGEVEGRRMSWKIKSSMLLSMAGLILCGYIVIHNVTRAYHYVKELEMNMQDIGLAMMGTGKYQFLLPFEAISILLLACIIGAIMIARKEKNVESTDNKDLDK